MMAKMGFFEVTGLSKKMVGQGGGSIDSLYHVNWENIMERFVLVLNQWKIMICTSFVLLSTLLVLMGG
jgi:hypothetical protein